ASAVAGAVVDEVVGAGRAPHPLSRSSTGVGADGSVRFHVTVGKFGHTLKVAGDGAVYDTSYDSHPAIGHGFLIAACEQAGADPEKGQALVLALAGLVRSDNDVAALVPAAAAIGF
ncbi:hypothetical protein, partial [Streptomyces sp.]|uniref:hypothetical protein n=1 Tax=Streptomyces sp. TaxID=1931 RepID=UPI002811A227